MTVELTAIYQRIPPIQLLEKLQLPDNKEEYLNQLQHQLTLLIGEVATRHCFSSSSGPLTNLKDYCELFCQNASSANRIHLSLSTHVYQVWLDAIHNLHLIQTVKSCANQRKASLSFNRIRKAIQALLKKIEGLPKQLINSLKTFKNNENVVFFLLRKKIQIINIFGLDQFNKLFSYFTKNQNLAQLLLKRYKSRGFDNLLPALKQEIFLYESYKHIST